MKGIKYTAKDVIKILTKKEVLIELIVYETIAIQLMAIIFPNTAAIHQCICTLNQSYDYCRELVDIENTEQVQSTIGAQIQAQALIDVPSSVLDIMHDENWQIVVVENPIKQYVDIKDWQIPKYAENQNVVGIIQFEDKEILINIEDFSDVQRITLHEVAHMIDYHIGILEGTRPSQTEEFVDIFNDEKENFGKYQQNAQTEMFAEQLGMYWENPAELRNLAPLTYTYINYINNKIIDMEEYS